MMLNEEESEINIEKFSLGLSKDQSISFAPAKVSEVLDATLPLSSLGEIKVYQQYGGDLCGFHTVFNCFNFLRSLDCKVNDFSQISIDPTTLNNGEKFWKYYHEMCDFIMQNYPNKNEVMYLDKYGSLDRGHFEFLLENFAEFNQAKNHFVKEYDIQIHFLKFYYGFGVIQNSILDIYDFNNLANELSEGRRHILTFFLGVTAHWSLLFVFVERGKVTAAIYLDSKNHPLSSVLQKDYDKIISLHNTQRKLLGKPPLNERETKLEKQWTDDICSVLTTIITALKGEKSIFAFLLDSQVNELELDVKKHTNLSLGESNFESLDKEKLTQNLYRWYDEEYRPQVITNDILQPMTERPNDLSAQARSKLTVLCKSSLQLFDKKNNLKEQGFDPKLIQDICDFCYRYLAQS